MSVSSAGVTVFASSGRETYILGTDWLLILIVLFYPTMVLALKS